MASIFDAYGLSEETRAWLDSVQPPPTPMPDKGRPLTIDDLPADWRNCKHRGPVKHERKANLCGLGGTLYPVFSCAVHGECVHNRFCERQPEQLCWMCPDVAVE